MGQNLIIIIIKGMASCAEACCKWLIIGLVIYFIGFNNILDFFMIIFQHIPLIGWFFIQILSIFGWIIEKAPLYYIYAILVCAANALYQIIISSSFRRINQNRLLTGVFYLFGAALVLPTVVSYILITPNLVTYLIIPFHLALITYYVRDANGRIEYNTIRNFVMFILIMPLFTSSLSFTHFLTKLTVDTINDL